ncbi:MAG: hypothetical protein WC437_04580 [Patescibacteria group bacterium]
MPEESLYKLLGIDPDKSTVREIFGAIVHNDSPGAFVNIARDPEYPGMVFTSHSDGDGSKFIQRLLHYLEADDETIFQGSADDAFSMNTGDIAASGFVSGLWAITQTINCNGGNAPKEIILRQIALQIVELLDLYRRYGFNLNFFMGGETADLPDQVATMVLDMNVYAREPETNLIRGNVQPGDVIYGFASNGQAKWEEKPNSGIMSNGLTLARTCLMDGEYSKKYPFLVRAGGAFTGRFDIDSSPAELNGMTVSEAILSPTRQWAIVIKLIIEKLKKMNALGLLHGISMNTGGGATKIQHVGQGIVYKKNMPEPPPIFQLIKEEAGERWRNMFQTFNCGIGIDVVGSHEGGILRECLQSVSKETGVELFGLGVCENSEDGANKIILETPYGTFDDY